MIFGPLRLVSLLISLIVVGVPLVAVGLFLTAIVGSPGSCEAKDRPIGVNLLSAASFQLKWDELNAALDAGQTSTVVVSESEATSRAQGWVEEHDAPVSRLFVCFDNEGGAASGRVQVPFLPGDVDVLIRGTLTLTGQHPEAAISQIKVGALPGPIADLVERFVTNLIDDQTAKIELRHDYGISFGQGEMTVSGQP